MIRKHSTVINGDRTANGAGLGWGGVGWVGMLSEDSHVRQQATIHV